MTVDANALFLNIDGVYTAAKLGIMARDLFAEGRVNGLAVAQRAAGANMSVDVSVGVCYVAGDTNTVTQPLYRCAVTAIENLVIAAADATNPRYDLIVAEVLDSTFTGVSDLFRLRVITGTPGASPAEPTLPASCLKLARVTVGTGVTSITTANCLDTGTHATVGLGTKNAVQRVTALPAYPHDGQVVDYVASGAAGVLWRLRYNAAGSTYKWESVGGPELSTEETADVTTASASWVDLTGGPDVTVPLAGVYDVRVWTLSFSSVGGAASAMSYAIGATAADILDGTLETSNTNAYYHKSMVIRRKTIAAASTILAARFMVAGGGGTSTFGPRSISIKPVMVA